MTLIKKHLDNGIRVVLVPVSGLKSVTVEVFVKVGSKYEAKDEAGMSHFLEHMAFKGTKKRPNASDINREIDSKGASYNAGTGYEYTSYYITTSGEQVGWAIELLSDILINSKYDEEELLKERGVIVEEIRMYQDNPMMGMSGDFMDFLYKPSLRGCWNVTGDVGDIINTTKEKLIRFKNKYWRTEDMVVVVAGNVDKKVLSIVEDSFGSMKSVSEEELPNVVVKWGKDREVIKHKDVEQGHFCIGVPALKRNDNRKYAFKLLDTIISGNTSSRLYDLIREKNGWAYYVFSISEPLAESGFFGVQSGVQLKSLDKAVDLVEKELIDLNKNITKEELKLAKEYINGKTRLLEDRSEFWSTFIGQSLILDEGVDNVEEELKKYNEVEIEEVKELAKTLFQASNIRKMIVKKVD